MASSPTPPTSDERGFTLIELLVVVLIIGILAAIAIPVFLDQQDKAHDATAKSAARSAQTAMEACAVPSTNGYTDCDVAALRAIEPTLSDADLSVDAAAGTTYSLTVTASTGHTFTVTRNADGSTSRSSSGGSW